MEYTLSNGVEIPAFGYGTADLEGNIPSLIQNAVLSGYRLIDTAAVYGSEEKIGVGLRALFDRHEARRKTLFLQTKLNPARHGYHAALHEFQHSLERLQTDYLDMYLIHWPVARGSEEDYPEKNRETWQAFEELYRQKKVRAIGVCNFLERHILQIMENCTVCPMLNQLELHPGYQQKGLVRFCRERGMLLEAWSPMGRGILKTEKYEEMAKKYKKNIGQLALRWSIAKGYIPISRSSTPSHISTNWDVFNFEICEEDMAELDALNTNDGFMDIWSYKRQQMY